MTEIEGKRACISQLEVALKVYLDDARYAASASRYGDLDGLIRTTQNYIYAEQVKLNAMLANQCQGDAPCL